MSDLITQKGQQRTCVQLNTMYNVTQD